MKIVHANGNSIAYRHRSGRGTHCVVFVNALGTEQCMWDDVVDALPGGVDTLTYDLRGHGLSGHSAPQSLDDVADDLIALVDTLKLRAVVLCGMGVGGMIAQVAAARRPEWLQSLVLVNTAQTIGDEVHWNRQISEAKALPHAEWDDALDGLHASDELIANMRARVSVSDYAAICDAVQGTDLAGVSARIDVPTLCIACGGDPEVPEEAVAHLASSIPNARLETLADTGPMAPVVVPEAIANLIEQMQLAPQSRYDTGMAIRRDVLGKAHVDRAEAAKTALDLAFQSLITESAWGTVWASPGISRRERSMLTLALLAALGNFDEIPMHVRATRRTGATPRDIEEVFQHVAIYAGVPRANHALKLARQTLAEMKEDGDD